MSLWVFVVKKEMIRLTKSVADQRFAWVLKMVLMYMLYLVYMYLFIWSEGRVEGGEKDTYLWN